MRYEKLFRKNNGIGRDCAQVHANHYSCTLEHILEMVLELKKDFPSIKDEDIQVQKYGGNRLKGITFVEAFFDREVSMPHGYRLIYELEYIL